MMDMIDPLSILSLVSFTIIVGSVGHALQEKTGIPDVLWLLLLGVVIGPVLGFYPHDIFMRLTPMMTCIAIAIILFDAGLNIDLYKFIHEMPKSISLALLTFMLSLLFGSLYAYHVSRLGIMGDLGALSSLEALLLSSMAAGISVVPLVGILGRLEKKGFELGEIKDVLILESVLTDPICIITSIMIVNFMVMGRKASWLQTRSLLTTVSTGFLMGFVMGLIWLFILNKIREARYDYLLTVANLFATYIIAEAFGGTGAGVISALIYGLVLGNSVSVSKMLNLEKPLNINKEKLIEFHGEIAFLIRSFFFVFLGLAVYLSPYLCLFSTGLLFTLQAVRWFSGDLVSRALKLGSLESEILKNISPKGLATAVVSFLPAIYGLPRAEIYPTIALIVILGGLLWSSLVTSIICRTPPSVRCKEE